MSILLPRHRQRRLEQGQHATGGINRRGHIESKVVAVFKRIVATVIYRCDVEPIVQGRQHRLCLSCLLSCQCIRSGLLGSRGLGLGIGGRRSGSGIELRLGLGSGLGQSGSGSGSLGSGLGISGRRSGSLGSGLGVSGSRSVSLGSGLGISGSRSVSLGSGLGVSGSRSVSLGSGLGLSGSSSVGLGSGLVCKRHIELFLRRAAIVGTAVHDGGKGDDRACRQQTASQFRLLHGSEALLILKRRRARHPGTENPILARRT